MLEKKNEIIRISVFADGTVRTTMVDKDGKEKTTERVMDGPNGMAFIAALGMLGISTQIFGKKTPARWGEAVEVKKPE